MKRKSLAKPAPVAAVKVPLAAPVATDRPLSLAAFVADPIGTSKLYLVGVQAIGGRSGPVVRAARFWRGLGVTHPAVLAACEQAEAKNASLATAD